MITHRLRQIPHPFHSLLNIYIHQLGKLYLNSSYYSVYADIWDSFDWTEIVNGEYRLTGNDVFHPPMPIPPAHWLGYTNHPWLPSYGHPINMNRQMNANTTPRRVII